MDRITVRNQSESLSAIAGILVLRGKIVTGDAIFCQKSIATKIVERGGDYVFPVKDNQKTLRQDIETAFNDPVFPPVLI